MPKNLPDVSELRAETLAKSATLPVKPAPVTLTGQFVRLEPLDLDRDIPTLFAMSNGQPATLGDKQIDAYDADDRIWRYMPYGPFKDENTLRVTLAAQVNAPNGLPMCVFDNPIGTQIGMANFMSNFPEHLKIELGSIWYSPFAQGTKANTEATYLMLRHAFDLGYRRLEWKANARNQPSCRAALRLGFKFECIQQSHYIIKGRNRDTAWYRILDREWPAVKARLETTLYGSESIWG